MYQSRETGLAERVVRINQPIHEDNANWIMMELVALDQQETDDSIRVEIRCDGGSVYGGLGIYDVMRQCRSTLMTVGYQVSGIAALLLAAGTRGYRVLDPMGLVTLVPLMQGASGVEGVLVQREVTRLEKRILDGLYACTNLTPESLPALREWTLQPHEAIQLGLADQIMAGGGNGGGHPSGG